MFGSQSITRSLGAWTRHQHPSPIFTSLLRGVEPHKHILSIKNGDLPVESRPFSSFKRPVLLTPGPLMTSEKVKRAMIGDWGSRDTQFMKVNQRVRERLLGIVNGQGTHVTIPLQGSGTFVVEAMLNTFIPRNGKVLVLVNGEYGERMAKICRQMDRKVCISQTEENVPNSLEDLEKILEQDLQISHVAAVYCETTTGMRNPISDVWERFLKKIWLEF